ncbi:MAG: hypothetical protein HYU36_04275 [Planctomycetes bacterium]|nr:hypothetical protein [Planctomycetota bacterium]
MTYFNLPVLFLFLFAGRILLLAIVFPADGVCASKVRWLGLSTLAIIVSVCSTRADLLLRLRLSEPALRDHAERQIAAARTSSGVVYGSFGMGEMGDAISEEACAVGLFTVYKSIATRKTVWMVTVYLGPPFQAGLCYSPEGKPAGQGDEPYYQHLYGPWWRWFVDV